MKSGCLGGNWLETTQEPDDELIWEDSEGSRASGGETAQLLKLFSKKLRRKTARPLLNRHRACLLYYHFQKQSDSGAGIFFKMLLQSYALFTIVDKSQQTGLLKSLPIFLLQPQTNSYGQLLGRFVHARTQVVVGLISVLAWGSASMETMLGDDKGH